MTVRVDGAVWFKGKASVVLIGNVGTVTGGLTVFPDASASDGMLEVGVVTAQQRLAVGARAVARGARPAGSSRRSCRSPAARRSWCGCRASAPMRWTAASVLPQAARGARRPGAITVRVPRGRVPKL